ncbi:unnamed protein product, partial [Ectocarpus fasciculatus]
ITADPWRAISYTRGDSWARVAMKPQPRAALVPVPAIAANVTRVAMNPPAVNAPKAPAIVAVCEVIDRPEYHRQGYFVTPDEDSVATRFLLIDPKPSSHLANGDVAAAAAARYASIHRTL